MSLLARRLLLGAGATLVAAALGWVVWELSQPARVPRLPFQPGREDPLLGWRLKNDWEGRHLTANFDLTVRTNAFGMRGVARTQHKAPGLQRILLLGDSLAFGWGVAEDQTFAALLERELQHVEVVSAGVPGWNAANCWLWLEREGWLWQPDLVLLQLCSNDLQDFTFFEYVLDGRNLPVAITGRPRLGKDERQRLLEETAAGDGLTAEQQAAELDDLDLDTLVARGIREQAELRRAAAGPPPAGPIAALSADEVRRGLDTGAEFQARYLRYVIDALRESCAARGVALRLLVIDVGPPDGDEATAALAALCAELPETCLPSDAFIPRDDRLDLLFRHDPHWTPEAHRLAAQALGAWLARNWVSRNG